MKRIILAALIFAAFPVMAQVTVKDPWVRATVSAQKATGAFMQITSVQDVRLIEASSPAAGVVEVHEMVMEKDVMKMRAVKGLDLPAGKTVELKPGGYHIMLMDLKEPLVKDSTLPLTLVFKDAKGVESKVELKLPVSMMTPGGMGKPAAMDPSMHGTMPMQKPASKP